MHPSQNIYVRGNSLWLNTINSSFSSAHDKTIDLSLQNVFDQLTHSTSPRWPVVCLTYAVLTKGPEAALKYLTIYSFIIIIIINIVVGVVNITTTTTN